MDFSGRIPKNMSSRSSQRMKRKVKVCGLSLPFDWLREKENQKISFVQRNVFPKNNAANKIRKDPTSTIKWRTLQRSQARKNKKQFISGSLLKGVPLSYAFPVHQSDARNLNICLKNLV